ncbi:MAG: helix-hairpin-helix domain-containing protein [Eubacteriaceae bacterium]|nr:helix-hairpin-helix domain-containing protein [Eubacteriaceae bacterium]
MDKFNMDTFKIAVQSAIEKSRKDKRIWIAAAAVLILIVAVLFFGINGKNDDIVITSSDGQFIDSSETEDTSVSSKPIYIDISGEVKNPGVYQVADGTRLFEVVEKAGGLTSNASVESINQAEIVSDGQKIIVPDKNELSTGSFDEKGSTGLMDNGLVNINIADSDGLQEIPGVGPSTAEKILAYRNSNGKFKSKEDLMNVSGIGQKTFDKIKDMITI